jgi:hypothetical protein
LSTETTHVLVCIDSCQLQYFGKIILHVILKDKVRTLKVSS